MNYVSHYGPALSVNFFGGFVYAGYGPFLQIYDYSTNKLVNKCAIFDRNKVHGVRISKNGLILIYGARSFNLTSIKDVHEKNSVVDNERHTSEWIISGEFNWDCSQFYLLTCYDRVLTCDLNCNVVKKSAVYGERSILYSGSIKVVSADKVFVNAGTVMGGIIVWELFSETLVANLLGHGGSIFYVRMNKDGSLVASCSDDRSVRLWDLKSQKELSIGWGHTARIWNLLFYNNDTKLISVSEDCTCRIWDIQGGKLLQRAVHEVHLTKNVWSVDVNEEDQVAVTSGNDGRLRMISLEEKDSLQKNFNLKQISDDCKISFAKQEIIKGFHWFPFGLVAITSEGNILQYDNHKWKFLMQKPQFKSYSMTNGINNDDIVVFSNNKCDLLILKFNSGGDQIVASSELHIDVLTKSQNCMICRRKDGNEFFVTLESPDPRNPFVCLKFDIENLILKGQFEFKKPASFTPTCLEVYESFLLVGSRFSVIAIYNFNDTIQDPFVSRRLTPGDTTTCINFVEDSVDGPVFVVTNRDGYYNFIRLKLEDQNEKFEVIHSNRAVRGFLEGAYYDNNGELITYGFKSELFYIYNETQCYEKAVRICGGAHRQWQLAKTSEGFMLIFIRASDIHLNRIVQPKVPEILQCGTHGREIRDISLLKNFKYKDGYLFCTGSEDTNVTLCHVNENTGRVTTFWTLRNHVSGLQRCKFINSKFMISSSAREELFLWELTTDCDSRPYIRLRQSLPTSGNNPDLRITDFSVKSEGLNFILATVYSDSAVKIWHYDHSQNRFKLLVEGHYKTCCILNVSLFTFKNRPYLMLSATDGHLAVYDLTDVADRGTVSPLPSIECSALVHQSSIKTMNISADVQNDVVKVYTGGDDNALAICAFHWEDQNKRLKPVVKDINRNATSSTVTSSELINHDNQVKLATVSVDQIVRIWGIENDYLTLQHQKYTTVADTGSLDVVNNLLLIGGVGLSICRTESH